MKKLVAYFSATGNTAKTAKDLAETIGADLFEIEPANKYTREDINRKNKESRSSLEMGDDSARPEISGKIENLDAYDTIYVGFPIWWATAPRIIESFLESYDFSGKTLVPFARSGGVGIEKAYDKLKKTSPEANWKEGKLLNGYKKEDLEELGNL